MNPALIAGSVVGVVLLAAFVVLLRSLISTRDVESDTASALPEVRAEKYRPMVRLLSNEDLEFLRSQAGYTPEMGRRLRKERRRVMRSYLSALKCDFDARLGSRFGNRRNLDARLAHCQIDADDGQREWVAERNQIARALCGHDAGEFRRRERVPLRQIAQASGSLGSHGHGA